MALASLGLPGEPFHDVFHARGPLRAPDPATVRNLAPVDDLSSAKVRPRLRGVHPDGAVWPAWPTGAVWSAPGGRRFRARCGRCWWSCAASWSRTACRCRGPAVSIGSVTFARAVRNRRPAEAFALGLRGGIFSAFIFAAASTAPDAPVTCSARSPIRNRNRAGAFCQVHRQVPGLLHSPRPVRVSGDAQDMDMAGSRLDRQEHVQSRRGRPPNMG
jgi:hypothetical protein